MDINKVRDEFKSHLEKPHIVHNVEAKENVTIKENHWVDKVSNKELSNPLTKASENSARIR